MAKKKEIPSIPPMKDELRKKLFPNNPPPTLKQLKELKNKTTWKEPTNNY